MRALRAARALSHDDVRKIKRERWWNFIDSATIVRQSVQYTWYSVIYAICTSHWYSTRSYCTIAGWTKRSVFKLWSSDRMPKCLSRFPRRIAYRRML